MDNTLSFGRRVFAIATAVMTILATVGFAAFAVPTTTNASSAGDLVRSESLSTVYYYGFDGARYTFPNLKTYNTWYEDFSDVDVITDSALADIDLAGNVVYRPGSRWIKITSDTKTYAVSTGGAIQWIETEDVATDYAGSDWNEYIDDVPDVFFVDYTAGSSLMSATAYEGMMYMDGSDYMLVWGGEMRVVSSAGRTANNMQSRFFLDGAGIDDSAFSAGDEITANICDITDVAQTGCAEEIGGDLIVSRSSSTPTGVTLPGNANSVEVFSFDLKATGGAVEVNTLKLTMSGLGATTNIDNVYLYEGSNRLTEARSVNSSTRQATFGSLNLDIASGETRTLTVRVEVSSAAASGDQIAFSVNAASDVTLISGDVSGSFPVSGNTFSIAGVNAGSVEVDKNGTITNPTLGEGDATIGQFRIAASGEDASIQEMTLKIDNSADHSDFKLWDGSVQLATGEYLGGKLVLFELNSPFSITEGNSNVFTVSADIGGEAADTIGVYFDNAADLLALGGDYGFGMGVDIGTSGTYDGATSCDATSDNCSFSTIQGGDLTLAQAGPTAGTISANSQDQTLLNFTITASQAITIRDLDIIVFGDDNANDDPFDATEGGTDADATGLIGTDEGHLTDIKIVNTDTGAVVMGPLELDSIVDGGDDADQTIDFSDDFGMEAGEVLHLSVRADIDNSITSGTEFGATVDMSGLVVDDTNGDSLSTSNIVPSGDITGYAQEVQTASVEISLSSTPGDVTTVDGSSNVEVVAFTIVTGEGSDVNVSSITISVYSDDDSTLQNDFAAGDQAGLDVNDFITSCSIYDSADALLDGPTSPGTNGQQIIFNDVAWTLDAGSSEQLSVVCNFGNPSDGTDLNYFSFDIADLSEDFVAEDADGTDVNATTDAPNGGTTPTNIVTVDDAGTLAVAASDGSPSADILLTSSTGNLVSSFTFTATNEDFTVSTLTFSEEAADDNTGTDNSSAYANNIALVTLSYPKVDGSVGTKTTTMSGNEAKFTSLSMYVATGEDAEVDVSVDVPASDRVSGGNATSNERVLMGLFEDDANDDNFKAVAVGSGMTLDDDDLVSSMDDDKADNTGTLTTGISTFVVRQTKPTISLSSSSPSGSGFVPGDQEVLRFNVAASANKAVKIDELMFKMSSTDNNASDWHFCDQAGVGTGEIAEADFDLYNLSTTGTSTALDASDIEWTLLTGDGTVCDDSTDETNYAILDLATVITVPAGTTYTFALYFDSTGASPADDDSVQFSIPGDPILSTYLAGSDLTESDVTATDTTLSVTSGAAYTAGDIICMDTGDNGCGSADEKMLVTAVATNDLTVVRAYLGTTPDTGSLNDAGDDVLRLPTSLLWQDDGSSTVNTNEYWGAYLVDSLPVTGSAMGF